MSIKLHYFSDSFLQLPNIFGIGGSCRTVGTKKLCDSAEVVNEGLMTAGRRVSCVVLVAAECQARLVHLHTHTHIHTYEMCNKLRALKIMIHGQFIHYVKI